MKVYSGSDKPTLFIRKVCSQWRWLTSRSDCFILHVYWIKCVSCCWRHHIPLRWKTQQTVVFCPREASSLAALNSLSREFVFSDSSKIVETITSWVVQGEDIYWWSKRATIYFLISKRTQNSPGALPASCGKRGSVQEVNQPGRDVNHPHTPPSSAKVKGEQSYRIHLLIFCDFAACYLATFTFLI